MPGTGRANPRPGLTNRDARALLEYHKLGATSYLICGYDPRRDAVQYGEELIPCVPELAADYDVASRAAGAGMNHR